MIGSPITVLVSPSGERMATPRTRGTLASLVFFDQSGDGKKASALVLVEMQNIGDLQRSESDSLFDGRGGLKNQAFQPRLLFQVARGFQGLLELRTDGRALGRQLLEARSRTSKASAASAAISF